MVEQSGVTKLTRHHPSDGTRSSVIVDVPFDADHDVGVHWQKGWAEDFANNVQRDVP